MKLPCTDEQRNLFSELDQKVSYLLFELIIASTSKVFLVNKNVILNEILRM